MCQNLLLIRRIPVHRETVERSGGCDHTFDKANYKVQIVYPVVFHTSYYPTA